MSMCSWPKASYKALAVFGSFQDGSLDGAGEFIFFQVFKEVPTKQISIDQGGLRCIHSLKGLGSKLKSSLLYSENLEIKIRHPHITDSSRCIQL